MSVVFRSNPKHGAAEDSGWVNEVVCGITVGRNRVAPPAEVKSATTAQNLCLLRCEILSCEIYPAAKFPAGKLAMLYCSSRAKLRRGANCALWAKCARPRIVRM